MFQPECEEVLKILNAPKSKNCIFNELVETLLINKKGLENTFKTEETLILFLLSRKNGLSGAFSSKKVSILNKYTFRHHFFIEFCHMQQTNLVTYLSKSCTFCSYSDA